MSRIMLRINIVCYTHCQRNLLVNENKKLSFEWNNHFLLPFIPINDFNTVPV